MKILTPIVVWLAAEHHRAYLYRVAVGAGGLALFYGLLSSEEVAIWTGAVATLFILPAAHTSAEKKK